ncbi:MAG TPA: biopolymer transporter ExbD [bacterium]|nr:biopolymer transporter ExbD [bacterium]
MDFLSSVEEEDVGFQMAPMVDVVLQLLIFFMCVTTFYKMEPQLLIRLPKASAAAMSTAASEIIISVTEEGNVIVDGRTIGMNELRNVLSLAKERKQAISIRGDEKSRHGRIIAILDACADIGIADVTFRTVPAR